MLLKSSVFFLVYYGKVIISTRQRISNTDNQHPLFNINLFEGDLKLPKEVILRLYNFSSVPGGQKLFKEYMKEVNKTNDTRRQSVYKAALSESGIGYNLWPDHVVYYYIDPTLSSSLSFTIHKAINHWEENTCLRFKKTGLFTEDYIYFLDDDPGCFSDSIGQLGGEQFINLQDPECDDFAIVVHEIGHAIGFSHEQSRQDRDLYIQVLFQNISPNHSRQFMKVNDFIVDNQGSDYDYSSIMHYPSTAFSQFICNDHRCPTMKVVNVSAYISQGRPTLGAIEKLSPQDILQANRMYSCPCGPSGGVEGKLNIFIRYGTNLPDSQLKIRFPNAYVKITAVDCSGEHVIKQTSEVLDSRNPEWYEFLFMGKRKWQFFRMSVWDKSLENFQLQLTTSQTIAVSSSKKNYQIHCRNYDCRSYVVYDHVVDDGLLHENEIKDSALEAANVFSLLPTYCLLLMQLCLHKQYYC